MAQMTQYASVAEAVAAFHNLGYRTVAQQGNTRRMTDGLGNSVTIEKRGFLDVVATRNLRDTWGSAVLSAGAL